MAKIFQTVKRIVQQIIVGGGSALVSEQRLGLSATSLVTGEPAKGDQRVGLAADEAPIQVTARQAVGFAADDLVAGSARADERLGLSAALAPVQVIAGRQALGVSADEAPIAVTSRQALGLSAASRVSGAPSKGDQRLGLSVGQRTTGAPKIADVRGGFAESYTIAHLVHRRGGNAVAETAVAGRTDWANDANAISGTNGSHDGSNATFAGNAAGARAGQLEIAYADFPNKALLTIDYVKLHFYGSVAGTLSNNADVQLKWQKNGTTTFALETITGNSDFSVTPKTHDITTNVIDWGELDTAKAFFSANAALGELWTANLDAIEIEIKADMVYIADASGNDNHGLLVGSKRAALLTNFFSAGDAGALDFAGADRNDDSSGMFSITEIDPSGWPGIFLEGTVRKTSNRNESPLGLVAFDAAGTISGVWLNFSAGVLQAAVLEDDVVLAFVSEASAMSNATRHDIACGWDGATLYFYVDGVRIGTAACATFPAGPFRLWAGRGPFDPVSPAGSSPRAFDGQQDNMRLSRFCRHTGATYTVSTPFSNDADTEVLWHCDALVTP